MWNGPGLARFYDPSKQAQRARSEGHGCTGLVGFTQLSSNRLKFRNSRY